MSEMKKYTASQAKEKRKAGIRRAVTGFFLALWAVIVLFPFYWMVLTSLKSYSSYNS